MSRGRCLGAEPGTPRQVAGSAMPPGSLDAAKGRSEITRPDCRRGRGLSRSSRYYQDKCRTDFSGRQQAPEPCSVWASPAVQAPMPARTVTAPASLQPREAVLLSLSCAEAIS